MSSRAFNSENAVIYKICCKNKNVKDEYIGSSVNFRTRKNCHKSACNNENDSKYNLNVYNYIRENGGWDNWEMVEICKANECIDRKALHKKEREYIELFQPTLNIYIPMRTIEENKEYNKEYREINKDKNKEYKKMYYQENKEKNSDYREENKEKIRKYLQEYREENKEKIREYQKQYREKRASKKGELNQV